MKKFITISVLLSLATLPIWAEKQIAIGNNQSKFEKIAAEELKLFLEEMTSDKYTIVPEKQASNPVIFLGKTEFAQKNDIDFNKLGREELVLKSIGEQLIISGGEPVGTLYGVYEFLQRNGIYFLGWDGSTVIPERKSVILSGFDLRKSPSIKSRFIYDKVPMWMSMRQSPQKYIDRYWRFQLRNRSGGKQDSGQRGEYLVKHSNTTTYASKWHSFFSFVNPKEYFATHPEYFTMNAEGVRVPNRQLCLSNPEVAKVATDSLRNFIKHDRAELPQIHWPVVYDITQMDRTKSFCECPKCREIVEEIDHSGLLWKYFINPIADAIADEYPDIQIRTYAYSFSDQPPPRHIKPAPNTVTFYCNMYLATDCYRPLTHPVNKAQLNKYNSWKEFGAPILMWDYWNMGGTSFFYPPRIETCIDAIIGNIRLHNGQDGLFGEYEISLLTPQMFFTLDIFMALQLMYDGDQDPENLIDIFMHGYYGAAAIEMRSILKKLRDGVARESQAQTSLRVKRWNYINAEFLLDLYRTLKQAENKVKDSPIHLKHVRTEMIVPLWEIVARRNEIEEYFSEAGYSMEKLKLECRNLTTDNYRANEPANPQGRRKDLTLEPLEKLLKEYQVPQKFATHADKVMLFPGEFATAKHKYHCAPGEDAESPYKKVAVFNHPDARYHVPSKLRFSVGGATTTKANKFTRIDPVPQDEKYHWYCIRRVGFSSRVWLDAWGSFFMLSLSSAYRVPSGIEGTDFNYYDVWFSVRVTGPAYVKSSNATNAVYLDMVVLTPPGMIPE